MSSTPTIDESWPGGAGPQLYRYFCVAQRILVPANRTGPLIVTFRSHLGDPPGYLKWRQARRGPSTHDLYRVWEIPRDADVPTPWPNTETVQVTRSGPDFPSFSCVPLMLYKVREVGAAEPEAEAFSARTTSPARAAWLYMRHNQLEGRREVIVSWGAQKWTDRRELMQVSLEEAWEIVEAT